MAMSLAPVLKQRFFDTNGDPLALGSLYTYASGTTTPQSTYTDSGGGTANANPVVLDANGEAAVWLDPTLSYKFVLKNAAGTTQFTTDSVIGLISAGTVGTVSLIDDAVTTAKLAADAVTADILADHASTDASRAVTTNHIRDSAVTTAKIAAGAVTAAKLDSAAVPALVPPTVQRLTSGTAATYNKNYTFIIPSGSATVGATYTIGGVTFTVYATVASSTTVVMSGPSAPAATGTLTKASGTGDTTLTYTQLRSPLYLLAKVAGGGGGGGGGGTDSAGSGGTGGTTTFGSSLITCTGGGGGSFGAAAAGGAGGTVTLGTGCWGSPRTGPTGNSAGLAGSASAFSIAGGAGGSNSFGGGGAGNSASPSGAGLENTGGGGGGAGTGGTASSNGGAGGGAGGYAEAVIINPAATYTYTIGVAGAAGAAGTSGNAGGPGGTGVAEIWEYYQ